MEEKKRYELKMVFDGLRLAEVRSWVFSHPDAFRIAYPLRQVNNIYFDTLNHIFMTDHLNGVQNRAKVRFRWYGEDWLAQNGRIEAKIKNGQLGYKKSQPISEEIDISQATWQEIIGIFQKNSNNDFAVLMSNLSPTIINQYLREYYESMDGLIRVTLDYKMRAFAQGFGFSPNISSQNKLRDDVVIEVKAAKKDHQRIADTLAEFPLYCTQNSKYLNGMEYAF